MSCNHLSDCQRCCATVEELQADLDEALDALWGIEIRLNDVLSNNTTSLIEMRDVASAVVAKHWGSSGR